MTAASIIARHDRLLTMLERPYFKAIAKEKNRYITAAATAFERDGIISRNLLAEHIEYMQGISERYNTRAIRIFAMEAEKNIKKSNPGLLETKADDFERWIKSVIANWVLTESGKKAKQTAVTTSEDVKKAIEAALLSDPEETDASVAKSILRAKGLSVFRADTIARTETHNASMYAMQENAKRVSRDNDIVLMKRWLPVEDSRTRETHNDMITHPDVIMEGYFDVERISGGFDSMDRPGDPSASAENTINCRCTLQYIKSNG